MGIIGGFWNPDSNALQIVQATAPSNPTVGQQWYDTDDNSIQWWNGSAWVKGTLLSGSYTPVLSQGASTNIAITVSQANWWRSDDLVWVEINITANGSGTAGAAISVSLPFSSPGVFACGTFSYLDFSALTRRRGIVQCESSDVAQFSTDNTNANLGVDPAITVASPDAVTFFCQYRTDAA